MDTFEVFTIGNAYFLDKIFNAIRMIFSSGLTGVLKIAVSISLGMLAVKACMTSNFKETIKWMIGVIVLTTFFLNTKAKVVIHDQLPDTHGRLQAVYIVDDIPWGLGWIAYATSNVGKVMMTKFETAFAGVTNNQTYRKYGILFGSKIVEDASKIRISNPDLRDNMLKFYSACIVPDLKMGHGRSNGYTFKELANAENIGEFLKEHASRARNVHLSSSVIKREKKSGLSGIFGGTKESTSTIDGYISCNKAAHHIYDMIEHEVESNKHLMSSSFIGQFMGENVPVQVKNKFFESVLTDTYGAFLKSSKDASEILKQNIMINSITDSAKSVAESYAKTTTDEMTRSSMYSVSQVFQKFIPIIRSVFECLFYGVAPLVLILMVTPIGLEVLKNYAFSFLYLQMWPPMYAILYVITESWSRFSSTGLKHNMISLPQIEEINYDIAMVSGYMLALIPILSMFVTKGLVASVGNMASSMMYIPQTAAVNASDQAVKGNFSIGNTSLDTHSYDNLNAHKHDDNHSWMSGMRSFQQQTGSMLKESPSGNSIIDLAGSTHNLAGRVGIGWNQAVGSNFTQSETTAQREMETASKDHVNSFSSGMSKALGYDSSYSKGTSSYDAINKSMTHDQREASDYVRGVTDRIAKDAGISSTDALKMAATGKAGIGLSFEMSGSSISQKTQAWKQVEEALEDEKFSKSLAVVESFGKTSNIQANEGESNSMVNSMKSDFNQASSASSRISQAREDLHSVQEARSGYESNSSNINVGLDNKFADWGMKKLGAEEFDKRTINPLDTNSLVQEFLKSEDLGFDQKKVSVLTERNLNLTAEDHKKLESDYLNSQSTHDHQDNFSKESANFMAQNKDSKTTLQERYVSNTADFAKYSNDKKQTLTGNSQIMNKEMNSRESTGEQKVDQLALEHAGNRIIGTIKKWKNNEGNKDEEN